MKTPQRAPVVGLICLILTSLSNVLGAEGSRFFAMDTALRDGQKRTAAEQAALLKELGYDGIGSSGFLQEDFLSAFRAKELRVFNTYLTLSFDSAKPALDPQLRELVVRLRPYGTALWVAINDVVKDGVKLAPSAVEGDAVVAPVLGELADLAQANGLTVALYPHTWCWLERLSDGVRLADKLNRPNLGVTFNLCHWLKVEGDLDPTPQLKAALPRLLFVSVNGADRGDSKTMNWDRLIQPLDAGTYNVAALLKSLRELGYRGPVGFQGFGIPGDSREILRRTIDAWRRMAPR